MTAEIIDYSALAESKKSPYYTTAFDRLTGALPLIIRVPLAVVYFLLLVVLLVILPIGLAFATALMLVISKSIGFVMLGIWVLLIGGMVYGKHHRNTQKRTNLAAFAKQNGWEYGPRGELVYSFNDGSSVELAQASGITLWSIKGQLDNANFEMVTGYQSQASSRVETTGPQLFVATQKHLPNAVLVARSYADKTGVTDKMFLGGFRDMERLSLEGDFDKWFQLYIRPTDQIDALSVVTPDLMQTAKEFINQFTIQLSGNTFSLLPHADVQSVDKQTVESMVAATRSLLKELPHYDLTD